MRRNFWSWISISFSSFYKRKSKLNTRTHIHTHEQIKNSDEIYVVVWWHNNSRRGLVVESRHSASGSGVPWTRLYSVGNKGSCQVCLLGRCVICNCCCSAAGVEKGNLIGNVGNGLSDIGRYINDLINLIYLNGR